MAFNLGALAGGFSGGMKDYSRLWRETEDQNVRRQQREAAQEAMGLMAQGPQERTEYIPSTDPNRQAITTQLAEQTQGMFDDNDPTYQEMKTAEEELFQKSGGELKSSVAHADFNKKLLSAAARSGDPNFFMSLQKKIDEDFNKKAKEYAYQGLIAAEQEDTDGMINAIRNYNGLLDNGIDLVATVKKDPKTGKDVVAVVFTDEETGEPLRGSRPQILTATTAPNIFKVLATDDMYWKNKEAATKERKYRLEERVANAQIAKYRTDAAASAKKGDPTGKRIGDLLDAYADIYKTVPANEAEAQQRLQELGALRYQIETLDPRYRMPPLPGQPAPEGQPAPAPTAVPTVEKIKGFLSPGGGSETAALSRQPATTQQLLMNYAINGSSSKTERLLTNWDAETQGLSIEEQANLLSRIHQWVRGPAMQLRYELVKERVTGQPRRPAIPAPTMNVGVIQR